MEKKFNEQESLQLISEMIAQARKNITKEDAFSYLLIGYSLVVVSLLNAVLLYVLTLSYMANWVWILMAPVIFISFYMNKKAVKTAQVRTHIDTIVSGIWTAFMYSIFTLFILLFGFSYAFDNWWFMMLVTPLVLVLMGFAQFVTAVACRYNRFYWGAAIFWLGGILCLLYFLFARESAGQYVIFALCVVGGFIIPGHMLNRKIKQNV